jgi:hypothetical protein
MWFKLTILEDRKMKKVAVVLMVAVLAVAVQATDISSSFANIDFDSGGVTTPGPFKGFDAPDAPEIAGWTNYRNGAAGPLNDAGVEAAGVGWWLGGYANQNAGFMSSGDAAYTMSTYTILSGDVFNISYIGARWGWTGAGQWTATLFYDTPANVIGSYVQDINSDWLSQNIWYSSTTGIAATPASVGGTLGILLTSTGGAISQIDEVTVYAPEPTTLVLLGFGALSMLRKRK